MGCNRLISSQQNKEDDVYYNIYERCTCKVAALLAVD